MTSDPVFLATCIISIALVESGAAENVTHAPNISVGGSVAEENVTYAPNVSVGGSAAEENGTHAPAGGSAAEENGTRAASVSAGGSAAEENVTHAPNVSVGGLAAQENGTYASNISTSHLSFTGPSVAGLGGSASFENSTDASNFSFLGLATAKYASNVSAKSWQLTGLSAQVNGTVSLASGIYSALHANSTKLDDSSASDANSSQEAHVDQVVSTLSTAPVNAGEIMIAVADTTGLRPGMSLTISGGTNSETANIVAVTNTRRLWEEERRLQTGTVTIDTPLKYSYAAGATITAKALLEVTIDALAGPHIANGQGIFEDVQAGWHCPPAQLCEPVCGDGILRGNEECDDGNQANRDGCDSACHLESGWLCIEPGRPCRTVCGDGLLGLPIEECDDGNTLPYDGCSPTCYYEAGRCAVQAAALCTGHLAPRSDVPRYQFCADHACTPRECCEPVPGTCQSPTGTLLQCSDGHRPRARTRVSLPSVCTGKPGERDCIPGCRPFQCLPGWTLTSNESYVVFCQGSSCNLTICCQAEGISCTCADLECCSNHLMPPQMIRAGSKGDLEFDLIDPIVVEMAGNENWYYYLRQGVTSLVELQSVFGGTIREEMRTMYLKGYSVSIPTLLELQAVISRSAPADGYATSNWHVWSSTQVDAQPGSYLAVHAGNLTKGSSVRVYSADRAIKKHIIFGIAEVFTVTRGETPLHRWVIREGMQCCFVGDSKFVEGVPAEIIGATYFALTGGEHDGRTAGTFVVMSRIPVTVYAVAIHDFRGNYKYSFESGFADLGWQQIASPGFRLMPWGFPMGCWMFRLDPGIVLQVPHHAGMYGTLAMKELRSV